MQDVQQENILSKVKKLIEKAASTDSIHEKEALMIKAQEMLQKHNLEMSQVENHSTDQARKEGISEIHINTTDEWEGILLKAIADNNFCKAMSFNGSRAGFKTWAIFGKESNSSVVVYMFNFFKSALSELSVRSYQNAIELKMKMLKEAGFGSAVSVKLKDAFQSTYLKDYYLGAANGIKEKMQEQKLRICANSSDMKGLMIVSGNEVQRYIESKYRINYTRSSGNKSGNTNSDGYRNGVADGRNIKANPGVGIGGQKYIG